MTFVDPACGSGSFLLGVYDYLLNWHLLYYSDEKRLNKSLKDRKIYEAGKDNHRLTIEEKQHILVNNIYGVDIDAQAVEVTKLSLYLKLMEGETDQSTGQLFSYSDLKLLPNLKDNIKCGNSLIGTDFYTQQEGLFDIEQQRTINAFDWKTEFANVFGKGGFDCVVGNPPYVRIQVIKEQSVDSVNYF
jgi:adenine-specific DNA-methyltransferase